MNPTRKNAAHRRLCVIGLLLAMWLPGAGSPTAGAVAFTEGNLLITQFAASALNEPPRLWEYTAAGSLVQTIVMPEATDFASEAPRDLVVDGRGNAQIHDRLFGSRLTEYNPQAAAFTSRFADVPWQSWNSPRAGGIAAYGDYIFVPSQRRSYPDVGGIIRFNLRDNTSQYFGNVPDLVFDMAMGYDGVLYTLGPELNPGGDWIDRFDPITMQHLSHLDLPRELTALAVAPSGHLFACTSGGIIEMDQAGNLLNSWTDFNIGGLFDIDVDRSNRVVATSHSGAVLVGDTSLTSFDVFYPPSVGDVRTTYAAFVQPPVPEPAMIGVSTLLLALTRRRRRGRKIARTDRA
jgi:hypothetical protein